MSAHPLPSTILFCVVSADELSPPMTTEGTVKRYAQKYLHTLAECSQPAIEALPDGRRQVRLAGSILPGADYWAERGGSVDIPLNEPGY